MKTRILGFVALAAIIGAAVNSLFVVPADLNQGDAQRVMYPHVASAWLAYASFGVTALAGIGYLFSRFFHQFTEQACLTHIVDSPYFMFLAAVSGTYRTSGATRRSHPRIVCPTY